MKNMNFQIKVISYKFESSSYNILCHIQIIVVELNSYKTCFKVQDFFLFLNKIHKVYHEINTNAYTVEHV